MSQTAVEGREDASSLDRYPMKRNDPLDPAPEVMRRREEAPISRVQIWNGTGTWLVTDLDHVRSLLIDPRMSVDVRRPGFPAFNESHAFAAAGPRRSFLDMDDPEHAHIRRMFTAHFSVKAVEKLRPEIRRITAELLDSIEGGPRPFDLMKDFGLPLTSQVICLIMGVPVDLAEEFQVFAQLSMSPETTIETWTEASERIHAKFRHYIEEYRREPNDGLLSELVHKQLDQGNITEAELLAQLDLVFVAGHDTTANQIGLGTLALLRQPDQGALLRDSDDPAFIRNAVDDLVRFITIVHHGTRRLALEDIEVDGVQIREGDAVIIALEAANRAPGLVDAPERLDFERKMTNHVAFGGGAHVCLGQHLARVELSEAYQGLLRRFPDLRLAVPFEGLHFLEEFVVYGVESVPLTWG